MEGFLLFLLYVITPLVLFCTLLVSFIAMNLWALIISAIGTMAVMFLLGEFYQMTKK